MKIFDIAEGTILAGLAILILGFLVGTIYSFFPTSRRWPKSHILLRWLIGGIWILPITSWIYIQHRDTARAKSYASSKMKEVFEFTGREPEILDSYYNFDNPNIGGIWGVAIRFDRDILLKNPEDFKPSVSCTTFGEYRFKDQEDDAEDSCEGLYPKHKALKESNQRTFNRIGDCISQGNCSYLLPVKTNDGLNPDESQIMETYESCLKEKWKCLTGDFYPLPNERRISYDAYIEIHTITHKALLEIRDPYPPW